VSCDCALPRFHANRVSRRHRNAGRNAPDPEGDVAGSGASGARRLWCGDEKPAHVHSRGPVQDDHGACPAAAARGKSSRGRNPLAHIGKAKVGVTSGRLPLPSRWRGAVVFTLGSSTVKHPAQAAPCLVKITCEVRRARRLVRTRKVRQTAHAPGCIQGRQSYTWPLRCALPASGP
jgi:hypothetical protein